LASIAQSSRGGITIGGLEEERGCMQGGDGMGGGGGGGVWMMMMMMWDI